MMEEEDSDEGEIPLDSARRVRTNRATNIAVMDF
jgi:hypothetical protein